MIRMIKKLSDVSFITTTMVKWKVEIFTFFPTIIILISCNRLINIFLWKSFNEIWLLIKFEMLCLDLTKSYIKIWEPFVVVIHDNIDASVWKEVKNSH